MKKIICPANRSFITIAEISSPDKKSIHAPKPQIRCFLKRSYCTCETFSSKVVLNAEMIMVCLFCFITCTFVEMGMLLYLMEISWFFLKCEHLLAANIAERLKIIQQVQLTDEEFGEALYLLRTP